MRDVEHLVTADELFSLSDEGVRRELIRGEVRQMPPAGGEHGATTCNLSTPLDTFVREKKLGRVFAAETGFIIERDPDTVRAPDCAFVSNERLTGGLPKEFIPFAPDLAVETVSPDDRPRVVREKAEQWIRSGARLVWVIEPARRTVTVYSSGNKPTTLGDEDVLEANDVVPGFRIPVADLWV